jgi:DHA1 family bicyclomycin/chloramphenicol resistance-like MFS transporter
MGRSADPHFQVPTTRPMTSPSLSTGIILVAMTALAALSIDITVPSLPSTARALGTDVATTQLTLSIFFFGFAFAQLVVGPLSDRFGRRPIVIIGMTGYTIASIVCALTPTIETLIAARLVQAVCACAGPVLGRAMVRDIYGPERAMRALANMMTVFAFVPAIAPMIGGVIEGTIGWRWNYALMATYGALVVGAIVLHLGESNRALNRNALSPRHLFANYTGLLRTRTYRGFALTQAFTSGGLLAYISGSSFVFIEAFGVTPVEYGFFFGAIAAGVLVGSRISASMSGRRGPLATVRLGTWFTLAGSGAMAVIAAIGPTGYVAAFAVTSAQICFMVGLGTIMPASTAGAIAPYPQMAGTASALIGFLQMTFGAVTGATVGHLFDGSARPMAFLIFACALAARACLAFVPRPNP